MTRAPACRQVVLGYVHGLFGVKGWIKLYSYTRPVGAIFDYRHWLIGDQGSRRLFRVVDGRFQSKTLIARLADENDEPIASRDAAMGLLDLDISVNRSDMPEPEPGQFYWADLIGLEVATVDNIDLGRVTSIIETGANDVLVVTGERERLIPMLIDEYVTEVDLESGRMIVDWDPTF